MKWKFCRVFVIVFFAIIMIDNKITFATKSTDIDEIVGRVVVELTPDQAEENEKKVKEEILKKLQQWGYDGNEVKSEMKIMTTFHLDSTSGGCRIRIGDDQEITADTQINVSKEVLKNTYGYPYETVEEGKSWEALIIIESSTTNKLDATKYMWEAMLQEVYTGDDIEEAKEKETSDADIAIPDVKKNESRL